VFTPDNIAWTRIFLIPFYVVFEMLRLSRGYKANIQEQVIIGYLFNLKNLSFLILFFSKYSQLFLFLPLK
jgi:hypothetical protein